MAISLACGERATLAKVDAFADGVAVKTVGRECFRLCRELVDGIVLVDNRSALCSQTWILRLDVLVAAWTVIDAGCAVCNVSSTDAFSASEVIVQPAAL